MSDKSCNSFETLSKINVNDHIEKKGGFSYLSWPFAVSELRKQHPDATWEVKRFHGLPYLQTPMGYFVEVEVIVDGIAMSQIHPVLDNRNQVIKEPNVFHINTSIQRCLVKAIALHGLGLYIYAGEDLPIDEEPQETNKKPVQNVSNTPPTQVQPKKETYVSKAVKQVMEAEQQAERMKSNHPENVVGHVSDAELRELFGDDIEIVDGDELVSESDLDAIRGKIKATKWKEPKDFGEIYKWIGLASGVVIKNKNDLANIKKTELKSVLFTLDEKANYFDLVKH